MIDVIEMSLRDIRGTSCETDAIDLVEDYIRYLEKLVLSCTDCPYGYYLENLREDFAQDTEVGGYK